MPQVEYRCPSCNAPIETKEKDRFCRNCGHPIMDSQGKTAPDVLLEKACVLMNQGAFALAEPFIQEALQCAPTYSDGYIVKLLCRLQLNHINQLGSVDTPLTDYEEFQKAIEYGTPYQAKRLSKLLESNAQAVEEKRKRKTADISGLLAQTKTLRYQVGREEQALRALQMKKPVPRWRRVLRIIEQVVMIALAAFCIFGGLFVPQFLLVGLPFVARLVMIILRNRRDKRRPRTIREKEAALEEKKALLRKKMEHIAELWETAEGKA